MRSPVACILACSIFTASAQQIGRNVQAGGNNSARFSTGAQLVVETVVVTGNKGTPIQGLTRDDFTVTENGVPQPIRFFEHQWLPDAPQPLPVPSREQLHIYDKLSRSRISTASSDSTRYKDHRLLALYFDMTAMQNAEQMRALTSAQTFIRSQMTAADLVAIFRYAGGSVDVLQDFTDDRNRLLGILESMIVGEGQGFEESTSDAGSPDTGAAFGQDDTEFNIFNSDRQLSALQTAATMLGSLNQKKALVYFASGLRLNGLNNQAQMHATVNAAIRAGVSFWPIDARGLVAEAPLGDATAGSPGGVGMYSGGGALAIAGGLQQSQDTLYALASDTGGKSLLDSNDLSKGIRQAAQSINSYYVIGYYTSNTAQDGKFRRIKITLNANLPAKLDYRQGYFAGKQFGSLSAADKERQLEDALMLPDPLTELTISMEIDYFQLNRAEYFVPLVVKIPGSELARAKRRGAERTLIDFVGEIKDAAGTTITNIRDRVDLKLTGATASELSKRPVVYDAGFTLLPGEYTIKFLARDAETGRIGTYQTKFTIPNLNVQGQRLAISSVVLATQRVDLNEALYNALAAKDRGEAANPLVRDREKLIPSVTRVFSRQRPLYVFLQAYQQDGDRPRTVVASVAFYHGQTKALEVPPITVAESAANRLKTKAIAFEIPVDKLAPGEYECQVTVLDPDGQKAGFWRGAIFVVEQRD